MESLNRWKYRGLLLTLVGLIAVYPMLRTAADGRWLFNAACTAVYLAAVLVAFTGRRARAAAAVLGLPALAAAWIGYAPPGLPQTGSTVAVHVMAGLFFLATAAAVLRAVHREPAVTADGVSGAFCGYLLVGLVFGHVYCIVADLTPGAFRWADHAGGLPPDETRREFLLTYFSLTTLTTVGFGDITPATDTARGLAAVEALVGQFYLAVLIGELIGKRVSRPPR